MTIGVIYDSGVRDIKQEYQGARNCKFATKADGPKFNSQENIKSKFEELKASRAKKKKLGGSSHDIDGEVVPNEEGSSEIVIEDEETQVENEEALTMEI